MRSEPTLIRVELDRARKEIDGLNGTLETIAQMVETWAGAAPSATAAEDFWEKRHEAALNDEGLEACTRCIDNVFLFLASYGSNNHAQEDS